jgi:hypothetical protein
MENKFNGVKRILNVRAFVSISTGRKHKLLVAACLRVAIALL